MSRSKSAPIPVCRRVLLAQPDHLLYPSVLKTTFLEILVMVTKVSIAFSDISACRGELYLVEIGSLGFLV